MFFVSHQTDLGFTIYIHSVFSIPAHPFGGLVLQVFFGQFGLVDAGILLLTQNFAGLSCRYVFFGGDEKERIKSKPGWNFYLGSRG